MVCPHGILKQNCKPCGGVTFCPHGRKERCKLCGGSAYCTHGRFKQSCTECGSGCLVCPHGKRKQICKDCLTPTERAASKNWCKACLETLLSSKRIRAKIQLCGKCDPSYPTRTEHIVRPLLLQEIIHEPSAEDDVVFGGAGCDAGKRRPDLAWVWKDRTVFLEIDENGGHPDRESSCELAKLWDQAAAVRGHLGEVAVYCLRFNPDRCDTSNDDLETRCSRVAAEVNRLLMLEDVATDPRPRISYYYYHSECHTHIEAARKETSAVVVCKVA